MDQVKIITRADGSEINILVNTVKHAKAQVVFAHGAGAAMSHEFMEQVSLLLNEAGINVLRFNFPYMDKRAITGKKYPPDRMPKLLACYQEVLEYVVNQEASNGLPLFIGGKSMGSRAAASLVAEPELLGVSLHDKVLGVFCLGYPFHPTKKPEKLRLEPLSTGTKPVLIVQGERDTLGCQAEIATYQLGAHCQCVFLEDGDHSLKPRVKSGFTLAEHMKQAVKEISLFIDVQSAKANVKNENK